MYCSNIFFHIVERKITLKNQKIMCNNTNEIRMYITKLIEILNYLLFYCYLQISKTL